MKAEFSVSVDVPHDLVRMTMAGFFERDDIARFADACSRAHRLLRCGPNEHLTLIDMRDMDIQPQGSVAAFQAMLADPATTSRRLAFVVSRSLSRMQIRRAEDQRRAGYFTTMAEAEGWLLERGKRLPA